MLVTSSSTVTLESQFWSKQVQAAPEAYSTLLTPEIISPTDTAPLQSQSPTQNVLHGVELHAGSVAVRVGVRVTVGVLLGVNVGPGIVFVGVEVA